MNISITDIFADLDEMSEQLDLDLAGIEIGESVSLEDHLGLDSLSIMDFLAFLERKYLVAVPNEQLNDVETTGDLVRLLNQIGRTEGAEPVGAGQDR